MAGQIQLSEERVEVMDSVAASRSGAVSTGCRIDPRLGRHPGYGVAASSGIIFHRKWTLLVVAPSRIVLLGREG